MAKQQPSPSNFFTSVLSIIIISTFVYLIWMIFFNGGVLNYMFDAFNTITSTGNSAGNTEAEPLYENILIYMRGAIFLIVGGSLIGLAVILQFKKEYIEKRF